MTQMQQASDPPATAQAARSVEEHRLPSPSRSLGVVSEHDTIVKRLHCVPNMHAGFEYLNNLV